MAKAPPPTLVLPEIGVCAAPYRAEHETRDRKSRRLRVQSSQGGQLEQQHRRRAHPRALAKQELVTQQQRRQQQTPSRPSPKSAAVMNAKNFKHLASFVPFRETAGARTAAVGRGAGDGNSGEGSLEMRRQRKSSNSATRPTAGAVPRVPPDRGAGNTDGQDGLRTVRVNLTNARGGAPVVRRCMRELTRVRCFEAEAVGSAELRFDGSGGCSSKALRRRLARAFTELRAAPLQRISKLPGGDAVSCKVALARLVERQRQLLPADYAFCPRQWLLRSQAQLRRFVKEVDGTAESAEGGSAASGGEAEASAGDGCTYIAKPDHTNQGDGIIVFRRAADLARKLAPSSAWGRVLARRGFVVQQYIASPLLMRPPRLLAANLQQPSAQEMPLSGRKFDVRLFVLVTGVMPLELYLCREALCRFAAAPYAAPTAANVSDLTMHLTNYAISKNVASVKAVRARARQRRVAGAEAKAAEAEGLVAEEQRRALDWRSARAAGPATTDSGSGQTVLFMDGGCRGYGGLAAGPGGWAATGEVEAAVSPSKGHNAHLFPEPLLADHAATTSAAAEEKQDAEQARGAFFTGRAAAASQRDDDGADDDSESGEWGSAMDCDADDDDGAVKKALSALMPQLRDLGLKGREIWPKLVHLALHTMAAVLPELAHRHKVAFRHLQTADNSGSKVCRGFHIFGLDVLLDSSGEPWLLELNDNPSLRTNGAEDALVKRRVVAGTLRVLTEGWDESIEKGKGDAAMLRLWPPPNVEGDGSSDGVPTLLILDRLRRLFDIFTAPASKPTNPPRVGAAPTMLSRGQFCEMGRSCALGALPGGVASLSGQVSSLDKPARGEHAKQIAFELLFAQFVRDTAAATRGSRGDGSGANSVAQAQSTAAATPSGGLSCDAFIDAMVGLALRVFQAGGDDEVSASDGSSAAAASVRLLVEHMEQARQKDVRANSKRQ